MYKILIELWPLACSHWIISSSCYMALFIWALVVCYLDYWESGLISISFPKRSFRSCKTFVLRINFLVPSPFLQVALITELDLILGEAYTVEWELKVADEEKIDCYPDENGVSAENCTARGCVWEVTMLTALMYIKILYT